MEEKQPDPTLHPPGDREATKSSLPDAAGALKLVSSFFDEEWAKTDVHAVHYKQLVGGLVNTLHIIRRDTAAINEPAAVIIRHFGRDGNFEDPPGDSIALSSAQQAVVYWEMSRRGWGPSIYGFFSCGRLEEYIDSHTLTAAESMEPDIRRDVARSYARLHSLQLPLRRDNFRRVVRELSQSAQSKHEEVTRTLLAVDDPVAREFAYIFQDTDWAQEMDWVSKLFEDHHCKITVTHGDTNHLNVLVKNFENDCRTVLIDYETIAYNYRGFDIGGHFTERMYCYKQPDSQLTGYEAPDLEEQRLFCEAYLQEMQDSGQTLSEYDTVDHLVLEANIGRLQQILFTNLICTVYDQVEVEPLFLSGLVHMMKTYKELKLEFLRRHQI